MQSNYFCIVAVVVAIAGCKKSDERAAEPPGAVLTPSAAATTPVIGSGAEPTIAQSGSVAPTTDPKAAPILELTKDGLGPIGAKAKRDAKAIQALVSPYQVIAGTEKYEKNSLYIYSNDEKNSVRIAGLEFYAGEDWLYGMSVYSPSIKGPGGFHVGTPRATVLKAPGIVCVEEEEEQLASCHFPYAQNVSFMFFHGKTTVEFMEWSTTDSPPGAAAANAKQDNEDSDTSYTCCVADDLDEPAMLDSEAECLAHPGGMTVMVTGNCL